ncbi:uncharacterized protein LOC124435326 [Xenia sp. Carnegie-2017]|uniref:uncharacterized protein LOC124435326 n=1 Tax=Xenia sp. Carnegie-2017 TaxID=2897299 RepID=UPI001F041C25|nr:uncharacterized protein LOC124435326 [Xenia sp. Carnegie-2017]
MSAEEKDEDVKQAQDFLNSFVERSAVYTDVENVPKQSFSMHCSKEEIHGECLHIALEYLRESGAPEILATMLAHQATAKVLEQVTPLKHSIISRLKSTTSQFNFKIF